MPNQLPFFPNMQNYPNYGYDNFNQNLNYEIQDLKIKVEELERKIKALEEKISNQYNYETSMHMM